MPPAAEAQERGIANDGGGAGFGAPGGSLSRILHPERLVGPLVRPAWVRAEAERCIEIFGKGGGYVLNSVHNIQAEVPPENVVAMLDAGRDHRYAH